MGKQIRVIRTLRTVSLRKCGLRGGGKLCASFIVLYEASKAFRGHWLMVTDG